MNAVAQLLLQREVAGVKIPDCVSFSATGNLRSNKSGSNVFPTHLVDRFIAIWQLEPTMEEWVTYATDAKVLLPNNTVGHLPFEFIAFNKLNEKYLFAGQNIEDAQDLQKSPTPRSCMEFGRLLARGVNDKLLLSGVAGKAYATEYIEFLKMFERLPDLDSIIKSPLTASVPTEIDVQYAVCTALALRANVDNYEKIMDYVERPEFQNKFVVCIGYYIVTRCPDVRFNRSGRYMKWAREHQEILVQ